MVQRGVVWWLVASPSLWCGVVRGWVWLGWFPPSPLWNGVPCVFRSALGVWYTHPYDDNDDDDGDDDHHHQLKHLNV